MLKSHNPYNVLSEIISFDNVQQMGEMIALKTLRGRYAYARYALEWLYVGLVKDLNRSNDAHHVFSDAYDLVQTAVCFLFEFVGKRLTDVYMIKNGQEITIKHATYMLVGRNIDRMRRHIARHCDLENTDAQNISVEIDHYEEKDYTEVDNKMELLNLKPRDRAVLDCYMAGMTCNEIAEFLDIDRITVWRRRTRAQVKYIGISRYKDEIYTNMYPQIIPTDIFAKVQKIMAKNKLGSSSKKTDYKLRGKLICGLCGKPMNGEYGTSENGGLNFYYKCSGRKRFKNCDKNNLKKDEIENLIINSTLEIFQSRSNIEFFADAVMETHRTRLRNQTVLNLLISDRNQKQRALENVMRAIEDGVYTATTKNRLQTLEEEIQVLNDKIIAEQCKLANEMKREDVIKYLENIIKNESQLLLDIFVQKVIVYEESVEVYYNYIENRNPDNPSVDSREFSLYGQKFTVTETALIISFLFENTLK